MLSVSSPLGCSWLEGPISQRGHTLSEGVTMVPMNSKSELMPGHCRFLVPKDQNTRGGIPVSMGHGSQWPGGGSDFSGSQGTTCGSLVACMGLLVFPCSVLYVKRRTAIPDRIESGRQNGGGRG